MDKDILFFVCLGTILWSVLGTLIAFESEEKINKNLAPLFGPIVTTMTIYKNLMKATSNKESNNRVLFSFSLILASAAILDFFPQINNIGQTLRYCGIACFVYSLINY